MILTLQIQLLQSHCCPPQPIITDSQPCGIHPDLIPQFPLDSQDDLLAEVYFPDELEMIEIKKHLLGLAQITYRNWCQKLRIRVEGGKVSQQDGVEEIVNHIPFIEEWRTKCPPLIESMF